MINLMIIYKFEARFFIAGEFSCPCRKKGNKIELNMKNASYKDHVFFQNKDDFGSFFRCNKLSDFYPIKTYFEYEGYEIDDETINEIKDLLGGTEIIWVNFQTSEI